MGLVAMGPTPGWKVFYKFPGRSAPGHPLGTTQECNIKADLRDTVSFGESSSENDSVKSRRNKLASSQNKRLKRMAQDIEDEDQSKKRKKWIENLSVLLSEDEEEVSYTSKAHEEEKKSILGSDNAIYLRFPYYMGSDDSDDKDSLQSFSDKSPKKKDLKSLDSSSYEIDKLNKENHSYKHTKRKQSSIVDIKSRKGHKNTSKVKLKCNHSKYTKTNSVKEKTKESIPPSSTYCKNSTAALKKEDKEGYTETGASLMLKLTKVHGSKGSEDFVVKKEGNCPAEQQEEFQVASPDSSRFLDSSTENSDTDIFKPKPRRIKYRRVQVFSTSSSSSDSEGEVKIAASQNLQQSDNSYSKEVQIETFSKQDELKPKTSISSEEEIENNSPLKPIQEKSEKSKRTNDLEATSYTMGVSSNSQTRPVINASAWKNIAIADIKAQHNKQSKVEELKRKLASSNASSIAIYKKIQKREMLRNRPQPQRPTSRLKPSSFNQAHLHITENASCSVRHDTIPSTSTSISNLQSQVDSNLEKQIVENSDSKNCKSTLLLDIPERRESLTEKHEERITYSHSSKLESQSELSTIDSDSKMPMYGRKIRQAHNSGLKNQDLGKPNQTKISPQPTKNMHSFKENKPKESKKNSNDTSKSYDVLGNIMSQMDKSLYKFQKPANKKAESTPDVLGWFPTMPNAQPSNAITQNMSNPQQPRVNQFQLQHNLPAGITPAKNTNLATNSTQNPSYNPLCPIVASNNSGVNIQNMSNPPQRRIDQFQLKHNLPAVITPPKNTTNLVMNSTPNPIYNPMCSIKASSNNTIPMNEKPSDIVLKNQNTPRVSTSSRINEKSSATSSIGEKIVPFYSAPQEDYRSNDLTSENQNIDSKSSGSKTENKITISSNSKSHSLDRSESSIGPSKRLSSNNPIIQDSSLSQGVNSSALSKQIPSAATISLNSKINNNQLLENQSNSDKNIIDPSKVASTQSQIPLSIRVSGEMWKNLKQNCPKNNVSTLNPNRKGIRVRVQGTEYRLPEKTADNNAKETGAIGEKQLQTGPIEDTSALRYEASITKEFTRVAEDLDTEKEVPPAKPASSSSTTSTSSSSDSSSSSDDSSSESSDESGKQSSTEGLSSGTSDSRASSPKPDTSKVVENQSPQTEDVKLQINSKENTQINNKDLPQQQVQDPHISSNIKEKISSSKNNKIDVITLSCDSDTNSKPQGEETGSQLPVRGCEERDQPNREIDPVEDLNFVTSVSQVEKNNTQADMVEELNDGRSTQQAKETNNNSNKVGKIRVKSLRELGVIHDDSGNENALQLTQAKDVSQSQSKGVPHWQSDTPSSSTSIVDNDSSNKQSGPNIVRPNNPIPRLSSSRMNFIIKKTSQSGETVYLPVVPIAVINPNAVRVRPMTPSQNQERTPQEKNKESNADTAIVNPSLAAIQSQIVELESEIANKQPGVTSNDGAMLESQIANKQPGVTSNDGAMLESQIANKQPGVTSNDGALLESQIANKQPGVTSNDGAMLESQIANKQPGVTSNDGAMLESQIANKQPGVTSNDGALPYPTKEVERFFFKLCDELFTDVVNFKIPKLAEDLHLMIAFDVMKEDRLKKIEQLITSDTVASEKRRMEKEYCDMLKFRGKSFTPLFMTILNKINKSNVKALFTAVYCRLVQQLERIEPNNRLYRFQLRLMIKSMLQRDYPALKKEMPEIQEIIAYLEPENEQSFMLNFNFIENLLNKYDTYCADVITLSSSSDSDTNSQPPPACSRVQKEDSVSETSQPNMRMPESHNLTERVSEDRNSTSVPFLAERSAPSNTSAAGSNKTPRGDSNAPARPPPVIGNLDQVFFKKR